MSRRLLTSLAIAALLLTGLCWVASSPVGSSPDDDFHLTSIWCVTAGAESKCPTRYLIDGTPAVETFVSLQKACFAGNSTISASCQEISTRKAYSDRINTGGYPGGYYSVMNVFSSSHIIWSVLLMRAVNFSLFVLLVGLTSWLASPRIRQSMAATLAVTLLPAGIFLLTSTNPSGWTVTGITVEFFGLLALGDAATRRRSLSLGVLIAVGAAMAAMSRGDGAAYAVAVAVLGGWLIWPTLKKRLWRISALVFPVVVGLYSYLSAEQVSAYGDRNLGADWVAANWLDIATIPMGNLGLGKLGGLGWFDTPMPAAVWATLALVLGVVVVPGLATMGYRAGLGALGATVLMLGLPLYMLQKYGYRVGEFVQPRYVLPLLIVVVGTIAMADAGKSFRSARIWIVVGSAVAIAQAAALYSNLARYANGSDSVSPLGLGTEWWWSESWSPLVPFILGSCAFAVFIGLTFRAVLVPDETTIPAPGTTAGTYGGLAQ